MPFTLANVTPQKEILRYKSNIICTKSTKGKLQNSDERKQRTK